MANSDGDDGIHYPSTINEELIDLGQLLNDVDDNGDATAALFGRHDAAPIDLEFAATGTGAAASAVPSPSDVASLASSNIGKRRSPV